MLPSDSGGVWLSFFFLLSPDSRYVARTTEAREHEAQERGNFSAPRLWLKCWVLFPVAARGEGDAPRPRRPGEAAPSATRRLRRPTTSRLRPLPRKKNGRARACTRRATGASPGAQTAPLRRATGASCDAQPARLPARSRRVSRRAYGASSGAQPARLAMRNRRVFRRAPSASSGAQSARLCGVRSICILNRSVLTLVLLL